MNASGLTERQVQKYVGDRSFVLGEEYFVSGAIFNARREGAKLAAQCRGSYRFASRRRSPRRRQPAHCWHRKARRS